jgi:hypothetical protein
MSNYYIVKEKEGMIWAEWPKPDGEKSYESKYNTRPHYPYDKKLFDWKEGQRVEEGKDFYFKWYNGLSSWVGDRSHKTDTKIVVPLPSKEEEKKATNIPDGENDYPMGAETYTRQQVYKLLYTQRAMISNDLKIYCGDSLTKEMYDILENPRKPEF